MIDTLVRLLPQAGEHFPASLAGPYALVTLHRPSNVDDLPWLADLLATLRDLGEHVHIVFPVHPRTRKRIQELSPDLQSDDRLRFLEPLPYLEFLALQQRAAFVITDSGGVQEETTFLGIPCLTVRENTERPVTIEQGTNQLVGRDLAKLRAAAEEILTVDTLPPQLQQKLKRPPLWDGRAAERIAKVIVRDSARS
jgi:UDP-N-acetylglucosamine 2-epimerase (non-hydrolysing)